MAFSSNDKSPLRQLVELNATMAHAGDDSTATLHTTLQIRSDEIDIGQYSVAVGFRAAYLVVDAEGGSVAPENKFGMRITPEFDEEKTTVERVVKSGKKQSSANEITGEGGGGLAALAAKITGKKSKASERTRDETVSEKVETARKYIPVEAIGGDRWLISAKDGGPLDAHFVTQSQRLCEIIKGPQLSNRFGASVSVRIRRRDIDTNITSSRLIPLLDPNKEAILRILMNEHLAELTQDANRQTITFACSEVYDEG